MLKREKLKTGTSVCGLSTRTSLPEHRTDVTRLLHEYHSYSDTIWLLLYFLSSANSLVVETITIIKCFYIKNALWDNWWGFTLSSQGKVIFSTKRLAVFLHTEENLSFWKTVSLSVFFWKNILSQFLSAPISQSYHFCSDKDIRSMFWTKNSFVNSYENTGC